MEIVRREIAESRAGTDQSLAAERAISASSVAERAKVRRTLDDQIERDRIVADERLWKFRQRADDLLAYQRSSSSKDAGVHLSERREADQQTRGEREDTDTLLERERQSADIGMDTERRDDDSDHAGLKARQSVTNSQLFVERHRADSAVRALGELKASLALAHDESGRDRDILAMVAHDLRSPLMIISSNAQHIAACSQEASMRDAADDVTRAAARMERLLTDLVDAARIDSGKLRIVKLPHDAAVLAAEILHSYQPIFQSRGMTFTANWPAEGALADFDHDRIVQVISNLLGNALKFSSPGGKVSLQVHSGPGGIEFLVRDDGPGIDAAELPHVFEQFWKLDSDSRRGLGLGLHICKSIVEGHGGRIRVESELGRGTTFFFTIA